MSRRPPKSEIPETAAATCALSDSFWHLTHGALVIGGLGLAGMLQIDDDAEAALPLPRDYGIDDVPVVIQDARFSDEGEFQKTQDFAGTLGDTLLVNGTIGPYFEATTDVVRLRTLNASAARVYDFAFDDDREFAMIASGGGLLEKPAQLDHIRLSPAERAEILVKLEPGETVTLRSNPSNLGESFQPITGSAGHEDAGMMGQFLVMEPGADVPSRWTVDETPGDDADADAAGGHQH